MVLHGSNYSTVDSDFAIGTAGVSTNGLVLALTPYNPKPSHWPEGTPFVWDARSISGSVVSLTTDAGDIDLLRTVPGVDSFEGLWSRSVVRTVFGESVRVASIEDLIAMKQAVNRPKDQVHIFELQSLAAIAKDLEAK